MPEETECVGGIHYVGDALSATTHRRCEFIGRRRRAFWPWPGQLPGDIPINDLTTTHKENT